MKPKERLTLRNVIRPCDERRFLAHNWGEKVGLFKGGCAGIIAEVFSWPKLNSMLSQHRLTYPQVRVMKNRESVRPETYLLRRENIRNLSIVEHLDLAMINFHLSDGASLIVNAVDEMDSVLSQLCMNLGRTFGDYVSANAYASFGAEAGFPLHWDDHEALILQVSGRKRWRVFEPSRKYPLSEDVEGNLIHPTEIVLDTVLEPGDTLYIPRGFWHDVTPVGEATLHLTLGAVPPTGLTWLRSLLDGAARCEAVRRNIPQFCGEREIADFKKFVLEALTSQLETASLPSYLSSRASRLTPRSMFSLPHSVDVKELHTGTVVQFAGLNHRMEVDSEAKKVVVGAFDRDWSFDILALPVIEAIMTRPNNSIEVLVAESSLTRDETLELIRYLLGEGFLSVIDNFAVS